MVRRMVVRGHLRGLTPGKPSDSRRAEIKTMVHVPLSLPFVKVCFNPATVPITWTLPLRSLLRERPTVPVPAAPR